MQYTRAGEPDIFRPSASPSAIDRPWPSEPVAASMPGSSVRSGCPCSGLPSLRSVMSCDSGKKPAFAITA